MIFFNIIRSFKLQQNRINMKKHHYSIEFTSKREYISILSDLLYVFMIKFFF